MLRALLAPENAGDTWTQSHLHTHVGDLPRPHDPVTPPSLGLVNKVVRELVDEAFLEKTERGLKVCDALGLLNAWKSAYRCDHPRADFFTLLKGPRLRAALGQLESVTGGHAAYAVFSAAERQVPQVRQPKVWLYVAGRYLPELRSLAEAKEVESGGNLVVLTPNDDGVFYLQHGQDADLSVTNPIQTYLDLCYAGERGEEAAEAIFNVLLKPRWGEGGMLK